MQALWTGVVFTCLVTWLPMVAAMRRAQLQRRVVKEVMVMLGVTEARFEEMQRREEERRENGCMPALFWGEKERKGKARERVEKEMVMGVLDEERMKRILIFSNLGNRIENLMEKESVQEIVEGLKTRAEDLREDVRVITVLIDRFQALQRQVGDIAAPEVWQC
jgi:uncharacterized protein YeeX (DUF496 family)